jgi:hypothetical protein
MHESVLDEVIFKAIQNANAREICRGLRLTKLIVMKAAKYGG